MRGGGEYVERAAEKADRETRAGRGRELAEGAVLVGGKRARTRETLTAEVTAQVVLMAERLMLADGGLS